MSDLREKYNKEIKKELKSVLGLSNIMAVPALKAITVNAGLGASLTNAKIMEVVLSFFTDITGQKPVVTRARKAISNFKIREGMPIGAKVTLRGENMWMFFEKFVNIVVPRIKDFRGFDTKSFDGKGGYSIGIKDHTIFPEIDPNVIEKMSSFEITFQTTGKNKEETETLLRSLGLPLKKNG